MPAGPFGWIDDPAAVEAVLKTLPNPILHESDVGLSLMRRAEPKDVCFWDLEFEMLGKINPAHYQARGTCVGQGFSRAVEHVALADILEHGDIEEWFAKVAPASIYGPSRVEIGGGGLRGDGSTGAWAAKSVKQIGVLLRLKYEVGDGAVIDLSPDNDETFCVSWGNTGMPDAIEPEARKHLISDASLVLTRDVMLSCFWSYKPLAFCSNQGFTETRDQYGMCQPSGSWAHCMEGCGAVLIKHPSHPNGLQTVGIWQSWGQNSPGGNNRVTLQTGEEILLPPGVFLIDADVAATRMLPARDTFALAGVDGWEPTLADFYLLPR